MPSSRRCASRKKNDSPPIPKQVLRLMELLQRQGYEAYAVGGCIRDSLLGLSPNDWDLTCSALPEETIRALPGYQVLATGLQHGTVTVVADGMPVEITTYRVDGTYSDGRHPDSVTFSRNLVDDLARRDFTVNAIAYHPNKGLVDPYNGLHDLHSRTLRCVGIPEQRFPGGRPADSPRASFCFYLGIHHRKEDGLCNVPAKKLAASDLRRTDSS